LKKNLAGPILFFSILFLTCSLPAMQKSRFYSQKLNKSVEVVKDEIVVVYKQGTTKAQKKGMLSKMNHQNKGGLEKFNAEVVTLSDNMSVETALEYYSHQPEVEFAEPNYIRKMFVIPNDTSYNSQWGVKKIDCPSAWEITKASWSVKVAIIDTGINYLHPDLAGSVDTSLGYDFVNDDSDAMDDNGHGTHVAGIISAMTNNNRGVAGVSWGARLIPIKALDNEGSGASIAISSCVPYAVDAGAKVINMSLGGEMLSNLERIAIDYAYNNGVICIAAAGNFADDGDPTNDFVMFPAALPHAIAVGASDSENQRAGFSNYGSELDIMAPGVEIYSTVPPTNPGGLGNDSMDIWHSDGYEYSDGTSMASPFVAGVVALIFSYEPNATFASVYEKITSTAIDLDTPGKDLYTGYGLINAASAVGYTVPAVVKESVAVNSPNPFNPANGQTTRIYLSDNLKGVSLTVRIYNLAGQQVRTIEPDYPTSAEWDGKNDTGELVSDGVYLYVAETDKGKVKGKLMIAR